MLGPLPPDRHADERHMLTRPLGLLHVIGSSLSVLWLLLPRAPGSHVGVICAATPAAMYRAKQLGRGRAELYRAGRGRVSARS